jgi:hydrogenase expression/formation protein HypE
VAAVLHEWADDCNLTFTLDESKIPIRDGVRSVCELLGLDPLHLANEGTFVMATQSERADETLRTLRRFDVSREAAVVGRVTAQRSSSVTVIRSAGREVALTEPAGAPLPRIC